MQLGTYRASYGWSDAACCRKRQLLIFLQWLFLMLEAKMMGKSTFCIDSECIPFWPDPNVRFPNRHNLRPVFLIEYAVKIKLINLNLNHF